MQKISLLVFKGAKFKELDNLELDYKERLGRFVSFDVVELDNSRFSHLNPEQQLLKESELLEAKVSSGTKVALWEKGVQFSSEQFSEFLCGKLAREDKKIFFIIGSANGLHPNFIAKCKYSLSLSQMTFTSGFARVILIEQIYRAYSIVNNLPYHKRGI